MKRRMDDGERTNQRDKKRGRRDSFENYKDKGHIEDFAALKFENTKYTKKYEDGKKKNDENGRVEKNQMFQKEMDPHKLSQRQKQIDFGKNTIGYDRYIQLVPKNKRNTKIHPMTPDKTKMMSKRAWDGRIRVWRAALHQFDPKPVEEVNDGNSTQTIDTPTISQPTAPEIEANTAKIIPIVQTSLFDDFGEDGKSTQEFNEDDLL
ncbi:hypothetical protein THRCLA_09280 [Thraustotheca clavata]|uniref:Histone RNA hairpin-binding protein RNA-binding domain-containing protein n=1 Tax=Thraustotheca clavata TaxID=74557 RepID=A0A1V9YXU1_9STRA|nr:hypothetical protein THRCLA_09280 [Thraustotheca clavata]